MNRGARRVRAGAASLVIAATLSVVTVTVAAPAQAQTGSPSTAGTCTRAARQWTRLVTLNREAKTLFARAQALQRRLLRTGRVAVAHRLDQRLTHLRSVHAALVARAKTIAARVQGRCSGRAPTLTSF